MSPLTVSSQAPVRAPAAPSKTTPALSVPARTDAKTIELRKAILSAPRTITPFEKLPPRVQWAAEEAHGKAGVPTSKVDGKDYFHVSVSWTDEAGKAHSDTEVVDADGGTVATYDAHQAFFYKPSDSEKAFDARLGAHLLGLIKSAPSLDLALSRFKAQLPATLVEDGNRQAFQIPFEGKTFTLGVAKNGSHDFLRLYDQDLNDATLGGLGNLSLAKVRESQTLAVETVFRMPLSPGHQSADAFEAAKRS